MTHDAAPEKLATPAHGIAIVGMACRFPGARNLAEYWAMLNRDPTKSRAGRAHATMLDSIDGFDAEFFRTTDEQARYIDPQQRLLLELAWEALEDGGVPPRNLRGSRTGMFVGLCNHDMSVLLWPRSSNVHMLTGVLNSLAANRVSHFFGLTGPSLCVDTACSSSLSAIHLACRSLTSGECSQALVAGVSIMTLSGVTETMRSAGLISNAGRCRPFAPDADGFVRAEGGGVVLLKSCRDALRDGNRIYASIDGSAINYNGDSNGLASPSPAAQRELLEQAYRAAGVDPSDVSYVEASATGSNHADAIECKTLMEFFLRERAASKPKLAIGSSKPAIGHVEGVSGIASLIKVALALNEGSIPGFQREGALNPMIAAHGLTATFPEESTRWEAGVSGDRIAGISSLGLGGGNAHIVVRRAPMNAPAAAAADIVGPYVLPLSARTTPALRELIAAYVELLRDDPALDLYSLCHAAATGREHFSVRCTFIARDTDDLTTQLIDAEQRLVDGTPRVAVAPQTYVCLDGIGTAAVDLFRRLRHESASMRALAAAAESELGLRVDAHEDRAPGVRDADDAANETPLARFLAEYCLGKLLVTYCPKTQGFVAAKGSELVRLALSGAISLGDAARVVSGARSLSSVALLDSANTRAKRPRRSAHVIGLCWSSADTGSAALRELVAPATVRSWHSLAEHESVAGFLAAAYVRGTEINWKQHYGTRPRHFSKLPHYPFQRTRHWPAELEGNSADRRPGALAMLHAHLHALAGERIDLPFASEARYRYRLRPRCGSGLTASRVFGIRMVTPATQVLMAAAHRAIDAGERTKWHRLRNVRMSAPITIPDDTVVCAQLIVSAAREPAQGRCVFVSRPELDQARAEPDWTVVMEAEYATLSDIDVAAVAGSAERDRGQPAFDAQESTRTHERLRALGYECDPAHQWDFIAGQGEYWIGSPLRGFRERCRVHPGMLDACVLTILLQLDPPDAGRVWLPESIARLDACPGDLTDGIYSIRIAARTGCATKMSVDFEVANSSGRKVLVATGVSFAAAQRAALEHQWNRTIPVAAAANADVNASPETVARRLMESLGLLTEGTQDEEMLESSLVRLGVDSLKALELRARLKRDYGYEISQVDMLNGLSGAALVARIRAHLEQRGGFRVRETTKTQLIELRARHSQDRLVQIEL